MATRDLRTELPAGVHEESAPVAAPTEKPLAFDQVRLRDGRVITVRDNTAEDDDLVDALLQQDGYDVSGVGQSRYLRACAALAIVRVDGVLQLPPDKMTIEQLHDRFADYKGRDMAIILAKFLEVNYGAKPAAAGEAGKGKAKATFPAE